MRNGRGGIYVYNQEHTGSHQHRVMAQASLGLVFRLRSLLGSVAQELILDEYIAYYVLHLTLHLAM